MNNNNSSLSNIKNSIANPTNTNKENKIYKQIWKLGNKYLVIIDESIIEKLGITENMAFFVEQQLAQDNKTLIMKVRKTIDLWKNGK